MTWDPVWEQVFRNQNWGKYPGEDLIRFIARNYYQVPDRQLIRVLEVGCGPGANLWYLAREGFGFCGVDGSATAIEQAAIRLDSECPGWRSRGELYVGDITTLPFPKDSFDAAIDNEAICCNPFDAARAIYAEMARVTKSGGKLFSRTFATGTWGDGTGEACGHNAWLCAEGTFAGKGLTRFTAHNEISELVEGFAIASVELVTLTLGDRSHEIREWIILGEKP